MAAPPRPSKSMVICTFFGQRGGSQSQSHVWFCVQLNRLSPKPSLLLELSLSTRSLVQEMRSGLLRIALECSSLEFSSCPLHQVPVWSAFCNGRRVGFAARRKPNQETREMLKKMESITVGAGVIQEFMYMRANYEWVVGGANSQSFHLISPDDGPAQELSVFLLRSSSSSVS
uniref:Protein MIZU-KUSSEI 1 n=2 Tax=Chenopodium quinoa TaxID=63459 RepID=A0A803MXD4_CHEQI